MNGRSLLRAVIRAQIITVAAVTVVARADDEAPLPPLPPKTQTTATQANVAAPQGDETPRPESQKPPKHCVGWAIAGGIGGAAVGFYAVYGITLAAGLPFFDSPAAFSTSVAAEGVGAIAGPILTCRLSKDPRIIPAASFVISGVIAGGAAAGAGTYFLLKGLHVDEDTDNPVASGLALLFGVAAGGVGGGYLGWLVSEAREPASRWDQPASKSARTTWTFAPLVAKSTGGVVLGGSF